ncbi:MAG: CrcB family protein [Alicyclobacillus sp.]|nr:CrcB family protein [Alicyclobacillus sp.]
MEAVAYLAVALGGCLGALARWGISESLGTWGGFPWATWLINLSGSFFLAWFYTITLERFPLHPLLRLGVGTGFVGAYTTFSTLTVDVWNLVQAHLYGMALAYVGLSLAGGLACAAAGYGLARRQTRLS